MPNLNAQTNARKTMAELLAAARDAGWAIVKGEIKPDGTMTVAASMSDTIVTDDFLNGELRMGE